MSELLRTGDRIELSRSHELRIDGDSSWVGMKISTTVGDDETGSQARDRLSQGIEEALDQEIDKVVEYVRKKSE